MHAHAAPARALPNQIETPDASSNLRFKCTPFEAWMSIAPSSHCIRMCRRDHDARAAARIVYAAIGEVFLRHHQSSEPAVTTETGARGRSEGWRMRAIGAHPAVPKRCTVFAIMLQIMARSTFSAACNYGCALKWHKLVARWK